MRPAQGWSSLIVTSFWSKLRRYTLLVKESSLQYDKRGLKVVYACAFAKGPPRQHHFHSFTLATSLYWLSRTIQLLYA